MIGQEPPAMHPVLPIIPKLTPVAYWSLPLLTVMATKKSQIPETKESGFGGG